MVKLIPPKLIKNYSNLIKKTVDGLAKCILVYGEPISVECPNCLWSEVHKKSSGVREWKPAGSSYTVFSGTQYQHTYYESNTNFTRGRCPVCHNDGKLSHPNEKSINALVTWKRGSSDRGTQEWFPAGLDNVMACRIKSDRCNYDVISEAEHFLIDGNKMVLFRPPDRYGMGDTNSLVVAYLISAENAYLSKTVSDSS